MHSLDRRVVCDLLGFNQDTYQAVRRLASPTGATDAVGARSANRGQRAFKLSIHNLLATARIKEPNMSKFPSDAVAEQFWPNVTFPDEAKAMIGLAANMLKAYDLCGLRI